MYEQKHPKKNKPKANEPIDTPVYHDEKCSYCISHEGITGTRAYILIVTKRLANDSHQNPLCHRVICTGVF